MRLSLTSGRLTRMPAWVGLQRSGTARLCTVSDCSKGVPSTSTSTSNPLRQHALFRYGCRLGSAPRTASDTSSTVRLSLSH